MNIFFLHSYELMDYVKFVEYTVWISVLALDRYLPASYMHFTLTDFSALSYYCSSERSDLHKDVIKGSEILEVLHQTPEVIVKLLLFAIKKYQNILIFGFIKIFFRFDTTCSHCTIASTATSSQHLES